MGRRFRRYFLIDFLWRFVLQVVFLLISGAPILCFLNLEEGKALHIVGKQFECDFGGGADLPDGMDHPSPHGCFDMAKDVFDSSPGFGSIFVGGDFSWG